MKKLLTIAALLILLTGCQKFKNPPAIPENSLQTYSNDEFGISFEYPATWQLSEEAEGETWRVLIQNMTPTDATNCSELLVQLSFVLNQKKDPAQDFAEFATGRLDGSLVETTIADKPAFRAGSSGLEQNCPGPAYIVELAPDEYALILTSVNFHSPDAFKVGAILDSLVLE